MSEVPLYRGSLAHAVSFTPIPVTFGFLPNPLELWDFGITPKMVGFEARVHDFTSVAGQQLRNLLYRGPLLMKNNHFP